MASEDWEKIDRYIQAAEWAELWDYGADWQAVGRYREQLGGCAQVPDDPTWGDIVVSAFRAWMICGFPEGFFTDKVLAIVADADAQFSASAQRRWPELSTRFVKHVEP